VLRAAYEAHPARFPSDVPLPPPLPTAARINKPPSSTITRKEPSAILQAVCHAGNH